MKHYKWRIYADNNIEKEIVDHLRDEADMDVIWIREDPALYRQQDDSFYYQKARELRRYLLTHDEDFWNDQQYPLRTSPGLIILPKNSGEMAKYFPQLLRRITQEYGTADEPIYLDGTKTRLMGGYYAQDDRPGNAKSEDRRSPGRNSATNADAPPHMDYIRLHSLEDYLFTDVNAAFKSRGYLTNRLETGSQSQRKQAQEVAKRQFMCGKLPLACCSFFTDSTQHWANIQGPGNVLLFSVLLQSISGVNAT